MTPAPAGTLGHADTAAEQRYVERSPCPELAGLVASVWVQEVAPGAGPYPQRNIPNGCVEVLCTVGSAPKLKGPLTQPDVDVLAPGTTLVGVRFHPGAASTVLGLPASELVDVSLDAHALWGGATEALGEAVDGAPTAVAALTALQGHIADRARAGAVPDPLVSEAVRQLRWRRDDVGSLTSALHVSERQLRRRCQDAIGLGPKTLHRMLRFQEFVALAQHTLAHGRAPSDEGLARLAAEAGYADQSHLNRECRRLTGVSPRSFLGAVEDACGCGHDHAASFAPVLRSRPQSRGV